MGAVLPVLDDNSGGSGSGYSYSVSGYCDTPYRDGAYIKVVCHASGSSTYSGTLYIAGVAVGSSWASLNGGSTSGKRTLSFYSPGAFSSRTVEVRCKGQDRRSGGAFDTFCYPTTGSFDTAMTITLAFDPCGGTTPTSSKTVTYGSTYGTLPTPTRSGYKFVGWFTEEDGGTEIKATDTVSATANQTLYAHWERAAVFHFVENGTVKTIGRSYEVKNGTVKPLIGIYVVDGGTVKQAT